MIVELLRKLIADGYDLLNSRIPSGTPYLKDQVDNMAYSKWAMSCISLLEDKAPTHARQIQILYNPSLPLVDAAENILGVLLSAGEILMFQQRSARVRGASETGEETSSNALRLHPRLKDKCLDHLLRGKYDDAVLNAGKVVEVYTRELSGLAPTDIGVSLMRKAFKPSAPKLEASGIQAEQQALMELFSGFIGFIKNPQSHRFVGISDYEIAVEVVSFANLLCRILDGFRR
jgi:uncharacterized protein (TIGR02391 family)